MSKWIDSLNQLGADIKENGAFLLGFFAVIVGLFVLAWIIETIDRKRKQVTEKIFTTRKLVSIGLFSALAAILMCFGEIQIFFIPGFYKLDFSELPILIGTFACGPVAGVTMEFVKILLKLVIKGTSTAFVGDLANFAVGCSLILPASVVYTIKKSKKSAILACVIGTLCITAFGSWFNAVYLLPAFSKLYGMPLDAILAMGVKVNPLVKEGSVTSFVMMCVAPLNLIKGIAVSAVTMFVYKPLSPIIKGTGRDERRHGRHHHARNA